jgi:hypothetical protein
MGLIGLTVRSNKQTNKKTPSQREIPTSLVEDNLNQTTVGPELFVPAHVEERGMVNHVLRLQGEVQALDHVIQTRQLFLCPRHNETNLLIAAERRQAHGPHAVEHSSPPHSTILQMIQIVLQEFGRLDTRPIPH